MSALLLQGHWLRVRRTTPDQTTREISLISTPCDNVLSPVVHKGRLHWALLFGGKPIAAFFKLL